MQGQGHISHPQEKPQSTSTGGGGEGGQDGYITLGGVGGWLAKPGSYTADWGIIYYRSHPLQEPEKSIELTRLNLPETKPASLHLKMDGYELEDFFTFSFPFGA